MDDVMKAMVAAAGLPALDDAEEWSRLAAWWREEGESEATLKEQIAALEERVATAEQGRDRQREESEQLRAQAAATMANLEASVREVAQVRADLATLRGVLDKLALTVPAVTVSQALREIAARCKVEIPDARGSISVGKVGPDEKWLAILRAVHNDARRALAAMETSK